MKTNFTSTAKRLSKGIAYVVFADGAQIGSRTTARAVGFKYAAVTQRSYAWAVAEAGKSLKHQTAELAKYRGYLANPAQAGAGETAYHRDLLQKWIADGTVSDWASQCEDRIAQWQARIVELATRTQDSPEFTAWSVYAFSNTGKESPKPWQHNFHFIALAQPGA